MNRKEFLKTIWLNFFKPIILIGVIAFSIRFLIRVFSQDDSERLFVVLFLWTIIIATVMFLISYTFKTLSDWITSKLSKQTLHVLMSINKVIHYVLPLAFAIMIYYAWKDNDIATIVFYGIFLFMHIKSMKKEKFSKR